jgi:hypothetical protein
MLGRVYKAVAWQRVNQIRYSMYGHDFVNLKHRVLNLQVMETVLTMEARNIPSGKNYVRLNMQ